MQREDKARSLSPVLILTKAFTSITEYIDEEFIQ